MAVDEGPKGEQSSDPLVGKVLAGRFRITALIDRGGMGKIYKAQQEPLQRAVALKVLDVHGEQQEEFRKRFFLEASLCSRLSHPNTVRVFDYGTSDDGVFFIAMEFLEGRTVAQLAKGGAIDPGRAVKILRQICGALGEAHDRGIVHRDLKPANVFLTRHGDEDDFVKVVDFGLVKEMGLESELSRTGNVLGSPMYMSPEQIANDNVDQRTDIYAAGGILYYLLTGRTPFKRGNTVSVLMAQMNQAPPPFSEAAPGLKVPESLEWVVMTCLEKDRQRRFGSMHELGKALKACDKELRGEWKNLELSVENGLVILPEGLEVSEEVHLSEAATRQLLAAPEAHAETRTVTVIRPQRSVWAMAGIVVFGFTSLFLVVVLGVLLVSGGFLFGRSTDDEPIVAPPKSLKDVRPAPTIDVQLVSVALDSKPSGAQVERDGIFVGTTPLTLRLVEGDEWRVTVSKEGHQPRTVRVATDQTSLTVPLTALAAPVPAAPVPQGSAPRPSPAPTPKPKPDEGLIEER